VKLVGPGLDLMSPEKNKNKDKRIITVLDT